jgi:hypothetical protein
MNSYWIGECHVETDDGKVNLEGVLITFDKVSAVVFNEVKTVVTVGGLEFVFFIPGQDGVAFRKKYVEWLEYREGGR